MNTPLETQTSCVTRSNKEPWDMLPSPPWGGSAFATLPGWTGERPTGSPCLSESDHGLSLKRGIHLVARLGK